MKPKIGDIVRADLNGLSPIVRTLPIFHDTLKIVNIEEKIPYAKTHYWIQSIEHPNYAPTWLYPHEIMEKTIELI